MSSSASVVSKSLKLPCVSVAHVFPTICKLYTLAWRVVSSLVWIGSYHLTPEHSTALIPILLYYGIRGTLWCLWHHCSWIQSLWVLHSLLEMQTILHKVRQVKGLVLLCWWLTVWHHQVQVSMKSESIQVRYLIPLKLLQCSKTLSFWPKVALSLYLAEQ